VIAEEIVEASWREVAELSEQRALTYMDQLARKQRELLTFVTTMTEHLSPAAQEIAIYAFVVIYRMFERAGPRLPKARRGRIIAEGKLALSFQPSPDVARSLLSNAGGRGLDADNPITIEMTPNAPTMTASRADAARDQAWPRTSNRNQSTSR
jgi:hypothetical protein